MNALEKYQTKQYLADRLVKEAGIVDTVGRGAKVVAGKAMQIGKTLRARLPGHLERAGAAARKLVTNAKGVIMPAAAKAQTQVSRLGKDLSSALGAGRTAAGRGASPGKTLSTAYKSFKFRRSHPLASRAGDVAGRVLNFGAKARKL